MAAGKKPKKRGLIMTGGGAKGFYKSGATNALHNTGMDFNRIFFTASTACTKPSGSNNS